MMKQRRVRSRQGFLRVAGAAGLASVAGCVGAGGSGDTESGNGSGGGDGTGNSGGGGGFGGNGSGNDGSDGSGGDGQSATIAILATGSLQNALSNGLKPAVDVPVQIEAHGSATVVRLIDVVQVTLSPPVYDRLALADDARVRIRLDRDAIHVIGTEN